MKIKLAIAAIATIASLGNALAGERYDQLDGATSRSTATAPAGVAVYQPGGELYPAMQATTGAVTRAEVTPSSYALGGELYVPFTFGVDAVSGDTSAAE